MDRRDFVLAGSLAAAASLRWLRQGGLFAFADIAQAPEPSSAPLQEANGVFAAIVRAVLPFDDARFAAITPIQVETRANESFSLDKDPSIQRNLALFGDLTQFATPPAWVSQAELALYPAEDDERSGPSLVPARESADAKAFQTASARWPSGTTSFAALPLAAQRAYLGLWARSALGTRRRFYQAMKTLVMSAAYSMDQTWPVIGYDGPLLHVRPS
ncbi:MAG: hypothetical protein JO293_05830 [Candidatus Eremiobacteraeota bacterium]|nr:hypothetical protein [Candidatus Eremiobacteraeota bacterium]MBV8222861.1 hypothetical protein [Candidatus Eremiobacteraeota bacterium]